MIDTQEHVRRNPSPSGERNRQGTQSTGTTAKFDRRFFLNTPDTSAALGPDVQLLGGAEYAQRPELVDFKPKTRTEMRRFLHTWANNAHDVYTRPGGRKILQAQPHATEILRVLGVDQSFIGDEQFQAEVGKKIQRVLATPEGWVLTKTLLEQQTSMQMFALGMTTLAALTEKGISPEKILTDFQEPREDEAAESGTARAERREQWKRRLGSLAGVSIGGSAGGVAGGAGAMLLAQAAPHISNAMIESLQFLANASPSTYVIIGGGVGGAVAGGFAGGRLLRYIRNREAETADTQELPSVQKTDTMFANAAVVLETIKDDANYAEYIKATIGIDVGDFSFDGEGTMKVIDRPKSTNSPMALINGVMSNLATRRHYFDDLGVPPSDRNLMPELFILKESTDQFERTGERVNAMILDRYNELGGTEEKNLPPENVVNAQKDIWGQTPDSIFYGRMDGNEITIPDFNPGTIRIRRGKEVRDIWNQSPSSPFYGRLDGSRIASYDRANLRIAPNAVDRWGQTANNPFFGRENQGRRTRQREIFVRDHSEDTFSQRENALYYGRVDGRNVTLATVPNPNTLPNGNTEPDIWGQRSESVYYGRMNGNLLPRVNRLYLPSGERGRDRWGQELSSPYHGRVDGRTIELPLAIDVNTLPNGEGRPDIWGQRPGNRYYGRVDGGRIPEYNLDNFDEDTIVDEWGQDSHNPFYRLAHESDVRAYIDSNIPEEYQRDCFGNSRRLVDGRENPFFGRESGVSLPAEPEYKWFAVDDIVDEWGQTASNPLFGRADATNLTGQRRRNRQQLAPFNQENVLARDSGYHTPHDAEFGLSGVGVPAQNIQANFFDRNPNFNRGLDRWGQPPGHPFFARDDAKDARYIPSSALIALDQWGQSRSDRCFLILDGREGVPVDVKSSLEHFRRARELVLTELTEKLVIRMVEDKPSVKQRVEQVAAKIAAREKERVKAKELTTLQEDLVSVFGSESLDNSLIDKIRALRTQRDAAPLVIIEGGVRRTIRPLPEQVVEELSEDADQNAQIAFGKQKEQYNRDEKDLLLFQAKLETLLLMQEQDRKEKATRPQREDEVRKLTAAKAVMERQGAIFGARMEFMADIGERIPMEGDQLRGYGNLSEIKQTSYTEKESDFALHNPEDSLAYFELLNLFFDYQNHPNRGERFVEIAQVLSPTVLDQILGDIRFVNQPTEGLEGSDLNAKLIHLRKGILSGMITTRDVRHIFIAVIDNLYQQTVPISVRT
jgi:hypothetical protein